MVVGAVGRRGREEVPEFGPDPLGMTVRDRREQHELASGHLETLLANPAFTQQHRLPAVEQCVYHRAPLLERGGGFRHFIASRRNGGGGFGGRGGGGAGPENRGGGRAA